MPCRHRLRCCATSIMDNQGSIGIVPVALTIQVVMAPERLESLLSAAQKNLGRTLAERVEVIVRAQRPHWALQPRQP